MSHSQGISGDDFYNPCPEPPIPPSPKIIFVPEINFWGLQIISKSCVYQDFKRYPVPVKESEWRRNGSILDLLFNYTFDYSTYSIYYTKVRSCDIDDININQRSTVRAGQLSTYVCDTSAALEVFNISDVDFGSGTDIIDDINVSKHLTIYNVFNITSGEKDLLDLLFLYKTEVDISTIFAQIDYNKLSSCLSKLIYIYLDIELNNNYSLYDNEIPVTDQSRLICWLYEKFVIDHLYRKLMFKPAQSMVTYFGPTDSTSVEPRLQIVNIETKSYHIEKDKPPLGENYIFLVHDGIYQVLYKDYNYQVVGADTTSADYFINWENLGLQTTAKVNNKIYLLWGYTIKEDPDDVICG